MQSVSDLELQLFSAPDALERVVRVVRHRGFEIHNCQFSMTNLGSDFVMAEGINIPSDTPSKSALKSDQISSLQNLRLRVSSHRNIGLLTEQLRKLFSVKAIEVHAVANHQEQIKANQEQTKTTRYKNDKQHSVV
jgi:acetolactate synthase regulatory subunit